MLPKADLEIIAKLVKVPVADLEKAIKDPAEVKVAIPEGLISLTSDEAEARDNNSKNDGIKTGKEIGVKEVRTKAGLEDSVGKDPEKVAQAIAAKAVADAKIEPDKKVTQLNEQIGQLQKATGEKDAEIATLRSKADGAMTDAEILGAFPKGRKDELSDKHYLTLLKSDYQFEKIDGKTIVKKDGVTLSHPNTKAPLPLDEALTTVFTDSKWINAAAGAGAGGGGGRGSGDNNKPGVFTKRSEVEKAHIESGKKMTGEDGVALSKQLAELKKANADFSLVD